MERKIDPVLLVLGIIIAFFALPVLFSAWWDLMTELF